jgi:hypothetical protein
MTLQAFEFVGQPHKCSAALALRTSGSRPVRTYLTNSHDAHAATGATVFVSATVAIIE